MLSLQQVLDEQKDLERLCQPRSQNRFEIYRANDNYGFAHIIKTYAGYPIDEPIYASIPHGIYLRDKVLPVSELNAPLPTHLNYPPMTQALWKKTAKKKRITPFSSPIHYVIKQFSSEVDEKDRRGTLFLPQHATQLVQVDFDKNAVIEELKSLPEEYHPITVCIHWQDYQNNLHKFFESYGFNIVSAGHFTDCDYLYRWLHLISQHKLVCHCGLGSALFYSVAAGTPFYLTKVDTTLKIDESVRLFNKTGGEYSSGALNRLERLRTLFSQPALQISNEQKEIVDLYTNASLVKKPKALLKQLLEIKAYALNMSK